jgi:NAD(P)-dependent dehydrogenase (short-subunit alcohol dehydrogenase family)
LAQVPGRLARSEPEWRCLRVRRDHVQIHLICPLRPACNAEPTTGYRNQDAMDRLKGKVAVVTGAALGIGRACVERMAAEGARIVLADVHDDIGASLEAALRKRGFDAHYVHCDVASEDDAEALMTGAMTTYGQLDVLVNNAGISGTNKPTHEISEAEWDQVMAVNVKGVFFCTKHALPHLRVNGGSIINLSSIYGLVGAPDVPPYHASKGAVRLMTKTDAMLYAADSVRVNSIHPGFIWTPMVENHLNAMDGDSEANKQQVASLHPLGHLGEPDDIAWGVVYLASDESKFMTGAELVIDGGYTCH